MNSILLLIFLLSGDVNYPKHLPKKLLDPTGTYKFNERTVKRDGDVYGYYGAIRVKLVDTAKIAMSFYVCKGAPGYNSGSFVDTLEYLNERAVYIPDDDSTCRITFVFKKSGIEVTRIQANLNLGCGFGNGVFADGYF